MGTLNTIERYRGMEVRAGGHWSIGKHQPTIVAIDPGEHGAIAVLADTGVLLYGVHDPMDVAFHHFTERYPVWIICETQYLGKNAWAAIELATTTGMLLGYLSAHIEGSGRIVHVIPSSWQSSLLGSKGRKSMMRECLERAGAEIDLFGTKQDQEGQASAFMILKWFLRKTGLRKGYAQ